MVQDSVASAEACEDEALVDESFLLSVLRNLVDQHILSSAASSTEVLADSSAPSSSEDRGAPACQESENESFERRLEALWDLCVEPRTAAFVVAHRGIDVLTGAVQRAQGEGRAAEICLGTLANICTQRAVAEALGSTDVSDLTGATLRGLSSNDGLAVLQALRLACALLCGPAALGCMELLGEAATERYLFCLEHSLRWEVVQHACNALSQGLVLEANASEGELPPATGALQRPAISLLLARKQLAQLLTARGAELAAAVVGDEAAEAAAEGDAEAALLSVLCLAESFVSVSECSPSDILSLGNTAFLVLARTDRPEILAAALELLATLGGALIVEAQPDVAVADTRADDVQASRRRLVKKAQHFATSTPGLAEKLTLLLVEGICQENIGTVAGIVLGLLQHVPSKEVVMYREDLASALAAVAVCEGFAESSAAVGGISARFMEWLTAPPAAEVQ